ncbi:hypothetical protein BV898_06889 [Hypsibius exemplaris]|uniref:Uncharacterized protein n=1 Tax=Hypsibius exemplaris TaxID=2072580 RepID=A0A1W0WV60_HYPEX|nr:hypothetical protein BV898_06889 [Hypsibius exemplaris]
MNLVGGFITTLITSCWADTLSTAGTFVYKLNQNESVVKNENAAMHLLSTGLNLSTIFENIGNHTNRPVVVMIIAGPVYSTQNNHNYGTNYNYGPNSSLELGTGPSYGPQVGPSYGATYGSSYGDSYGMTVGNSYGNSFGPNYGPSIGPGYGVTIGASIGPSFGPTLGSSFGSSYGVNLNFPPVPAAVKTVSTTVPRVPKTQPENKGNPASFRRRRAANALSRWLESPPNFRP